MKYLLTLLLAVCSPCVAQTKVWEWNAPNIDHGGLYGSDIVAWASDRSGNSAIVLGEHAQTTSPVIVVNRLRILWISSKGKVLHESTQVSPDSPGVILGEETSRSSGGKWSVLFVTASKLIISDGQKVILGRVKAGKATVTVGDAPEGGFPQRGDSTSAFPGWIQKHGEPAGYFYASNFGIPGIGEAYGDAYHLTKLSLWRY